MKVWVVTRLSHFAGFPIGKRILGIYSSEEKAKEAARKCEEDNSFTEDKCFVSEEEVQ